MILEIYFIKIFFWCPNKTKRISIYRDFKIINFDIKIIYKKNILQSNKLTRVKRNTKKL